MKLIKLTLSLILASTFTFTIAQDLPQVSPKGKVEQTIGLTNISIEYSRPSVKGRKIFGDLVPFDQVWRLGANACTKITTDQYLKFGDQILEPGTYAVFSIPGKEMWKIVFNTNIEQWGAGEYDAELDVVTLDVKPQSVELVETLEIGITNLTMNSGSISIKWEETQVELPFKVSTKETAEKNIKEAIDKGEDLDMVYYKAAKYHLSIDEAGQAREYIGESIKIEKSFRNLFLLAKIQKTQGEVKEAFASADEALNLAKKSGKDGWADYIEETITEWKGE